jgi:hypothetical protein
MMAPILDWLRANFIYIVAFILPLAGAVLAVVKFSEGEREECARIAAASVLGACVYAIAFTA